MMASLSSYIKKLDSLTLIRFSLFAFSWCMALSLLAYFQGYTLVSYETWFYLVLGFFAARTSGMCLNRLIDRDIDEKNPRTATRALPSGEVTSEFTFVQAMFFLSMFIFCASKTGKLALEMSLLLALLISFYSYTKRFTSLCHFFLGLTYFVAVLTFWAAFAKEITDLSLLFAFSVSCSITGSDILYAIEDREFDKSHKIHSIPARFGIVTSLIVALVLYSASALALFSLATGPFLYVGAAFVLAVYLYSFIKAKNGKAMQAFEFANTNAGICYLFFVLAECLWRAL